MDVILLIEKGSSQTRVIRIKRALTTIGRRHGCDLRIPSARVSRRHCILASQESVLTVEDLDSANGTFLNGQRVHGTQVVHPGDRLTIGPVTFVVEYEPPSAVSEDATAVDELVPLADVILLEEEEDWGEELMSPDDANPPRPAQEDPRSKSTSPAGPAADEKTAFGRPRDWQPPAAQDALEFFSETEEDA